MSIEHTILAVLSFWPSTGYNIKSEFEHKAAGLYWGMSYGSIYPKLKKLEEEGFIYAIEQEDEGRKKKMYELTAKGWKEFENWLKIPPSFPIIKDELLMKMSTWHEDMDNEVLISHLLKRKEETSDILKFVQEWPRNGYSYVSKLGCLSIRYAEMKLETEIKWIEESIEALQNNNLPDGQDPHGNTEKLLNRRRRAIGGDKGNCQ
ncbi:helix-turn-helix transcriptional regulator [Cytobacillus pseudoceanisediminis]|uniref:Helix-turn-helix transcriptional regulator n=1 Tax=Cytobacillus pseudoceanisediminis TaxID=3051614 RepID=A0ABZ2ZM48_9BACI